MRSPEGVGASFGGDSCAGSLGRILGIENHDDDNIDNIDDDVDNDVDDNDDDYRPKCNNDSLRPK